MNRPLVPITLDNYKPLRELVFESLRQAIVELKLKPGERLMEIQLAEDLGVSRTPVREAIRKLELEGFVVMMPRKGAYVAGISMKDIADIFEIRGALEGLAASLAAERGTEEEIEQMERELVRISESIEKDDLLSVVEVDTDFHAILFRASRNDRLAQMLNHLREQIQRFRTTSLGRPGRMRVALEEHKKIVEALSQRDPDLSRARAQEHIENAESSMIDALREAGIEGEIVE